MIFVSSIVLLNLWMFSADADTIDKPNIILIYTDDQGYGDVSCLNPDAKFQTPNMDRIAQEGLTFTNAHCSDTVCTPSRYGLLVGRYCWRTSHLYGNHPEIAEILESRITSLIMNGRTSIGQKVRNDTGWWSDLKWVDENSLDNTDNKR